MIRKARPLTCFDFHAIEFRKRLNWHAYRWRSSTNRGSKYICFSKSVDGEYGIYFG